MEAPIHLVFTLDRHFVQHCGVVITSVFKNAGDQSFVIHLVTNPEDATALEPLRKFIGENNARSEVYLLDQKATASFKVSHHVTTATYYRLFIPELLAGVDKVIYLDSDVVVNGSLLPLWETDLKGKTIAAVRNGNQEFFNAGVMLIAADQWRLKQVTRRCVEWIGNHNGDIVYWDQDVLNTVLENDVLHIDAQWNYIETVTSYEEVGRNGVKIIHFVGAHKPWSYYCTHPLKDEYFKYLKMSPWKSFKIYEHTWRFRLKAAIKSVARRIVGS